MKGFETNTATTQDWLRASENMTLSAYEPISALPVSSVRPEDPTFTKSDFEPVPSTTTR
jgi:hypothetical protein